LRKYTVINIYKNRDRDSERERVADVFIIPERQVRDWDCVEN